MSIVCAAITGITAYITILQHYDGPAKTIGTIVPRSSSRARTRCVFWPATDECIKIPARAGPAGEREREREVILLPLCPHSSDTRAGAALDDDGPDGWTCVNDMQDRLMEGNVYITEFSEQLRKLWSLVWYERWGLGAGRVVFSKQR